MISYLDIGKDGVEKDTRMGRHALMVSYDKPILGSNSSIASRFTQHDPRTSLENNFKFKVTPNFLIPRYRLPLPWSNDTNATVRGFEKELFEQLLGFCKNKNFDLFSGQLMYTLVGNTSKISTFREFFMDFSSILSPEDTRKVYSDYVDKVNRAKSEVDSATKEMVKELVVQQMLNPYGEK